MTKMKKFNRYYLLLAALIIAYIACVIFLPIDPKVSANRYGLSSGQIRVLSLSIVLPFIAIWGSAFYGFVKVKQYAALIDKDKAGHGLRVLSDGLMLLAISLPLTALAGIVRDHVNNGHLALIPTTTIIYNYFSLLLALAGVWLVAQGARQLVGSLKKKRHTLNQTFLASAFTAFCIFYTYIAMTDPLRRTPGGISGTAAYYLPDALVFLTIVVPYIVLWYLGFRAAYHIQLYRRNITGVLYRKALGYLAAGIAFVVVSMMALRLCVSMSSYFSDLSLRLLLLLVYFLLIIIGVGYGLIARGAKRLKKIEEV